MERFIELIHETYPLPAADLQRLLSEGEEIGLSRGTVLVRQGQVDGSLYLVKSGVLRGLRSDAARDSIVWFVVPGEIAFSSWGYVQGKPAQVSIAASTDCTVLRFGKQAAERLFDSSPALAVWGRRAFERLLLTTDVWLVDLVRPLAADRYLALVEKMPELLQQVPLKEIAAYLGVTPQSLSRIRAGLVKNK